MTKTILNINSYNQMLANFDSYDEYKQACQYTVLYDKQIWKVANGSNNRTDYEYYLQHFPSGFYKDEAKKRVLKITSEDNKLWGVIKKEKEKHFYENYLNKYPDGLNAQEARTRIGDINSWEIAKYRNTKDSYKEYLLNYPNGLYKTEAKVIVDEHETWETAKANNSKSLYREYLRKYPNGIYSYQTNTIISQILAKEKKNFWKGVKYSAIALIIIFIISAANKGSDNKPVSNQQPETETLYVNTQQIILRAGAGSEYGEISKIPYSYAVIVTENAVSTDGGNWVKVKIGNLEGWLNKKLLSDTILSYESYGEVIFGSSLANVEKKLGEKASVDAITQIAQFQRYPKAHFTIEKGIVTVASFENDISVPNILGLSLGMSLKEVKSKYPSVLMVFNESEQGYDLIFRSSDNKKAIVIHEREGKTLSISAGLEPYIEEAVD